MILAVVDDILFKSKIAVAARHTGARIEFARSAAEALEHARTLKPVLAIFDLNDTRLDPLGTIAALKSDPDLQAIRTVGYVRHTSAEVIARARAAGADEVLAQSAFVTRLGELLSHEGTATG
jgi:CheY-like chemotaxis protein